MATPEQLTQAFVQALGPLLQQLQTGLATAITGMMEQTLSANTQAQNQQLVNTLQHFDRHVRDQDGERKGGLNERRFRELGSFDGKDDEWKEFALRFRANAKEADIQTTP